jgi:predicted  nucleic acid-binding Zn-ribbon protein
MNLPGYVIRIPAGGFMKELLQNLLKLQSLEFGEIADPNADAAMAALRSKIPPQILAHYERLTARGKKGVALVRNQICTGCHMRLPIGVITTLMHARDIQLCDTCGRYLCLAEAAAQPPAQPAAEKAAARPRKRKAAIKAQS